MAESDAADNDPNADELELRRKLRELARKRVYSFWFAVWFFSGIGPGVLIHWFAPAKERLHLYIFVLVVVLMSVVACLAFAARGVFTSFPDEDRKWGWHRPTKGILAAFFLGLGVMGAYPYIAMQGIIAWPLVVAASISWLTLFIICACRPHGKGGQIAFWEDNLDSPVTSVC